MSRPGARRSIGSNPASQVSFDAVHKAEHSLAFGAADWDKTID